MATELLPLTPGTLPPGVCYAGDEQARLVAFSEQLWAQLNGQAFYNYGDTKPAVENQGYVWVRKQDMRIYRFEGVWISPNPETSSFVRRLFVGSTTDLQTYDGGDAGAPSDRSGPMWEVDTEFAGRSPVGPGTIPSSDPAVVVAVAANAGEGSHQQTIAEMPAHTHGPKTGWEAFIGYVNAGQPSNYEAAGGTEESKMIETGATGGTAKLPLVHPVRGVYLIKRSAVRQYYAVP